MKMELLFKLHNDGIVTYSWCWYLYLLVHLFGPLSLSLSRP